MILHSIRVEGWRCFAAAMELGPFDEGLNIIHGPNGSGKSTLMTALVRGLFDSHTVTGEDIKTLRPWGRSLIPKVTIEFSQEGVRYELNKQFLNSPSAQLRRWEDGCYVPLAESRDADEQARRILAGEAPGRGVTDQRHWGMAQILWASQGQLRIDSLSDGTRATIQNALAAQITGPGAEGVEKRIAAAYTTFFTPGGKLRGGASAPAVVGLQNRLEQARQKREEMLARLDEFEQAVRRIEDLNGETEQARRDESHLNERLAAEREQAQQYSRLMDQKTLYEREMNAAEERYTHWKQRIDEIANVRNDLKKAGESLRRLEEEAPAQARLVEQRQHAADEAKAAVDQVRVRRGDVTSIRRLAETAARFCRAGAELQRLDKQLQEIEDAMDQLAKLREQRSRIVAPDADALSRIQKTVAARDKAWLQLDAALIAVHVTAESDMDIEITTGEEPGRLTLGAGDSQRIQGAPEVAFRIPGVGSFRATGPTGSVEKLRKQRDDAIATLEELTAGYGTDDVDQLAALHKQAQESANRISQAEVRLATLLGDRQLDQLRDEQSRQRGIVEEILASHAGWQDDPPDPDELVQRAEEAERQFTTDIDQAEAESDRAQQALNQALQKQTSHSAEIRSGKNRIEDMKRGLDSLCGDGLDDAQRAARLTDIAMQRDAAKGKCDAIRAQLAEFGDDPAKSVAVLEGRLNAVRQEVTEASRKLNTEQGRVEQIIAEAPYSQLAAAEEAIGDLQDEIARENLQIQAVRLLYETLQSRKREVIQSVIGPVRLRANQTLQRIAGNRFQDIQFDQSLLPSGVAPRSAEESVSLELISGGEREQLFFAVRLALADVAFPHERQLVVLDDVFTYTDTARLARIATVLDEAADRFQVILLTCHPERYRGLPRAKFFDLAAA